MRTVTLVRQKHTYGCAIACMAMITGHSYDHVYGELKGLGLDVDSRHGLTQTTIEQFLGDHGFAMRLVYRWHYENRLRPEWPLPPFAPVHIVGISNPAHDVVMLADRTVLDPMRDERRWLPELGEVEWMLGIWNVSA